MSHWLLSVYDFARDGRERRPRPMRRKHSWPSGRRPGRRDVHARRSGPLGALCLIKACGELVECHRPSGGNRGFGGNADVCQHHLGATSDLFDLDSDFGRGRVTLGHPICSGDLTLPFSSDMESV